MRSENTNPDVKTQPSGGHGKQRMAGWTPLPNNISAQAVPGPSSLAVMFHAGAAAASAPDESVPAASTEAACADQKDPVPAQVPAAHKQRMAGHSPVVSSSQVPAHSPAPDAHPGVPAVSASSPVEATAPARKQRMGPASSTGEPGDVQAASDRRRIGSATSAAGFTDRQASVADSVPPPHMDGRSQADNLPSASPGIKPQDPKERIPAERAKWVRPALMCAGLITVSLALVLAARWLYALPSVQDFLTAYPGHASLPASAPEGLPAWLGWQHFFNIFFMVLIVRTGLQVRLERRPAEYWTPKKNSLFSPRGNMPKKVALSQWMHQVLDVLWVLNGAVFIILLFVTGQWMRIVPMSWDIFPNMLSAGLQYASLNWPTENGWINYNALQVTAYFLTVFVGAPLAIVSGVRLSTWWPEKAEILTKKYPVEWARAIHFPVMIYFVAFTGVHVFLVFFTGALRNLNHMYTSRDAVDGWGLVIFLASLLVIAAAWFLTRPVFTTPIASQMGKVSR